MFVGRNEISLLGGASAFLITQGANAQDAGASETPPATNQPVAAQPNRTIGFSVPMVSANRVFGDIFVEVDQQGNSRIDAANLRSQLAGILNDDGLAAFDQAVASRAFVAPDVLAQAGFQIEFDQSRLQLNLISIDPKLLAVQQLGPSREVGRGVELRRIDPENFSTYLNITANIDYDSEIGTDAPDIFLDGATRFGDIVVEYDGAVTDQFGDSFEFLRRATRVVYDDPDSYTRYTAGDLTLESFSVLRNPQIGGIAIEKRRQIFDPFLSVTQLGGRQIFLDNRSTVDVLINGERFDTFQLDAGTYDLSNLPIQQGSNEVELLIRDSFGRERVVDYSFFFENLSLPPGEEEYSLAVGVLSRPLGFQQDYSDEIAATGFYRKAFSENLVLGGAFQASGDAQVIAASVAAVPQFVPGVFDIETAVSNSDAGVGLALRAGYQFQSGGSIADASQFSFNIDYESSRFRTIDLVLPINFDLLSVGASYTRSFGERVFAVVGGNYVSNSGRSEDNYNAFFDVNYRVSDRLRISAGMEYGSSFGDRENFGVRIGLTWALGGRTRFNADFRSRIENYRMNISRGADNRIGSFGYDVGISRFGDQTQADGQLQYVANRFTARADVTSSGNAFEEVFDQQRARLQIGTSVAFAGDTFGIGRPISNSFALARPHKALKGQGIVTARTLDGGDYYARSGVFGSALQGDLSAYSEQNIQFDTADPEDGFDIGDGVVLVEPPYKSGYTLVIGDEYFVSVIGFLADDNGPVALQTGRVESADGDEEFEALPFFTNAKGRFALFGVASGRRYKVTLPQTGRTFTIEIPQESGTVVRTGTITIPVAK